MRNLLALLLLSHGCGAALSSLAATKTTAREVVEHVSFDWDHSGHPTDFTFTRRRPTSAVHSDEDPDSLIVKPVHGSAWIFVNHEDAWTALTRQGITRKSLNSNLIPRSKRMLFVAAAPTLESRVYLVLVGAGSGCCVGSLDVITAGDAGTPRVVFHAQSHLLKAVVPLEDGSGIELIGQSSGSEAWALKNAQSYNPYRVYVI